ncbi:peptidase S1 [Burkholderia arboris]|uniref:S10 family peptidase n=1 Tax=Burkholderia arboris TaxID=488730 RepID=UPI001CA4130C|nr:peptidase S1 [Burkholderia arboris]MBY8610626.1 peptidase S1 [Burkholderia arboris]
MDKKMRSDHFISGRRTWCLPVALALSVALLSACGGDDGPAASSAAVAVETPADTPTLAADKPYFDPVAYGNRADDSITDTNEDGAITHHVVTLNGTSIQYTATAGHLVTTDPGSSQPNAKIFYVAYTADGKDASARPVTFFYNGGPGSAAVWLLLGSYAPKRIKTSMPDFTPPAPYTIETNPDSLLDKTDLVFINPVGTGYSTAIAPAKNKNFWGVDQDASSLKQFIKRYLTANQRWNSPKFLFGESYGTPRTAVLANVLHSDGVDLNGIVLQSSILDYRHSDDPVGLLPTYVADAWYHKKFSAPTQSTTLAGVMSEAAQFASGDFATLAKDAIAANAAKTVAYNWAYNDPEFSAAMNAAFAAAGNPSSMARKDIIAYFRTQPNANDLLLKIAALFAADIAVSNLPAPSDAAVQRVAQYIGIDKTLVQEAKLLVDTDTFQRNLVPGRSIGGYDGRVTTTNLGVAADVSLINNDAFNRATDGVYIAAWNVYLNQELKYTSNSAFTGSSDASQDWDWTHKDPTGETSQRRVDLNTVTDLAAIMGVNPDLKVFQASGYFDDVTPWYQTRLDLQNMQIDPALRKNLQINEYPSGHMIYLDPYSRTAMRGDMLKFFQAVGSDQAAMRRILRLQKANGAS